MVVYDNESYISWFPQGLAYLASAARNAGHEVSVYQQDIYHWPDEHLTYFLDNNEFDVVEVSVIGGYYQYRKLIKLSTAINASKTGINLNILLVVMDLHLIRNFFLEKLMRMLLV